MSVNLVNIPSTGFGEEEYACFCLNDLKDQDVVGHDLVNSKGNHSLTHFMERECAKTWVKTKIIESRNLEGAHCPQCFKTINAASILSQQEIDECMPRQNVLHNRPVRIIEPIRLLPLHGIHNENEGDPVEIGAMIGGGIGAGIGGYGAILTLAAGVGTVLSTDPIGFGVAFVATLASVIGVAYTAIAAGEFMPLKYNLLAATALCGAGGSAIGALAGAATLTGAAVGAFVGFAQS